MPDPVTAIVGGSTIIGGGLSAWGASEAADKQLEATNNALAIQQQMFQKGTKALQPFVDTGTGAMYSLAQLYGLQTPNGAGGDAFNDNALEAFRKSPDYDWRFKEGMRALTFSDAAKGLLQSRGHLANTVSFGQGMAGTGFNDYASRLLQLSQIGANSAGNLASVATGQGNALASTTMAAGQAEASGIVGTTNAITGSLSNATNNLLLYNLMNKPSAYSGSTALNISPGTKGGTGLPGYGGLY